MTSFEAEQHEKISKAFLEFCGSGGCSYLDFIQEMISLRDKVKSLETEIKDIKDQHLHSEIYTPPPLTRTIGFNVKD